MSKGSIGLSDELNAYLVAMGAREPEVLGRLREETAVMPEAGMQIAVEQGALLSMLVRLLDARRVPDEPRDRVDARMRPRAQLRLGELGEEPLDEAAVNVAIAAQEEPDRVHFCFGLYYGAIHTFMNVLAS